MYRDRMTEPSAAGPYPEVAADAIGWLTEEQMIEVDRVMIEELGIDLIQMMENAGRNLATLTIDRFTPEAVTVLVGSGGNGGGGLVAARHLGNRGVEVSVTLSRPAEEMTGVPAHQLHSLMQMGIEITEDPRQSPVTIDAMIGYSLRGAPRGRIGELVGWVNSTTTTVVALDTPSGLHVTTGMTPGVVVDADATLTLAMPKIGLRSAPQVGDLYIGDISVPPSVYGPLGVEPAPPFRSGQIIRCNR